MSTPATVKHTPGDLEGRGRFMPAYSVMLQMCGQLIYETVDSRGLILIVGAGGGLELEAFARRARQWRFCAVDPDSGMIEAARDRARSCDAFDRVTWVDGFIDDAPPTLCDAATCLLSLHFVAGDAAKRGTLEAIRRRLKPGAPFLLADLCLDKGAQDYPGRLARYRQFALDSGAPSEQADEMQARLRDVLHTIPEDREAALIADAGFKHPELFYAGHSWRGWIAHA